jgi:hypothetical protein
MNINKLLIAFVVFTLSSIINADSKPALDAWYKGDYVKSFEEWKSLAEQGDAEGQYSTGLLYGLGRGTDLDMKQAVQWLEKSAEQGYKDAQNKLGLIYSNSNPEESAKWYRKSAEQGDAESQYKLAYMYYKGEGVLKDYTKVAYWYQKSAEQGYGPAQNILGMLYLKGEIVNKDNSKGKYWINKAYENSNSKTSREAKLIWDSLKLWKH